MGAEVGCALRDLARDDQTGIIEGRRWQALTFGAPRPQGVDGAPHVWNPLGPSLEFFVWPNYDRFRVLVIIRFERWPIIAVAAYG